MKNPLSQRSRLAADWIPTEVEFLAIQAAQDAPQVSEVEEHEEPAEEEIIDPRWLRGGASYQRFPVYESDEEEAEAW